MPYVVDNRCIGCKHLTCVDVCPVDCFFEGDDMLVIDPEICIDCGICVAECPEDAIIDATESEEWAKFNAEKSLIWPNITPKK
mgnify:FL=1